MAEPLANRATLTGEALPPRHPATAHAWREGALDVEHVRVIQRFLTELPESDRGCTFPGCTVPGYATQVPHATRDWARGGRTDIDDLTLACGPHNRLVEDGGWSTRKLTDGTTEWIPPPGLPLRGGTNSYHRPDRTPRQFHTRRE